MTMNFRRVFRSRMKSCLRALIPLAFALLGSLAPSYAGPTPAAPVSFRTMERVTRALQRPAVDAVLELHENLALKIDKALDDIEEAELLKRSQAYQSLLPNFRPALEEFIDSPFGQEYLKARAQRIALAPAKLVITSSRFELPTPPDPTRLTGEQLDLLKSLHTQFAGTLEGILNVPGGIFNETTIASVKTLALNNSASLTQAENLLRQVNGEISQIQSIITIASGINSLGSNLVQSLNALTQLDATNIGQLTPILESLGGLRGGLSAIVGGDATQILSQLTSFEGSVTSLISTLTGGGIVEVLGFTQGITSLLSPLQTQLGSLTGQLSGLLNTQSLINLVNIPFLSTAQGLISSLTNGLNLNIPGLAGQILGNLSLGGGLVQLIQQLFSISGAEAFIMSQFGAILQSFTPVLTIMNGSLLGMIDSVLANSPLDLGNQLNNIVGGPVGSLLSPSNALLQMAWGGESLFTGAVQGGLQQLLSKINLPLPVGTLTVLPTTAALTIKPEAAAVLSAMVVSKGSVPKLVFGTKKRRATSQNFCSSITSPKRRATCLTKVSKDWVRFQAKLRSLSGSTVSSLASKKVVEQIEAKAFGKPLSTIIGSALRKAAAVKIQP